LDCLVVLTVSEIFEVRDFSLKFLSLLGRVSAHQATSFIPNHQKHRNKHQNTKKQQLFRSKPSTQARLAKNSVKFSFCVQLPEK